MYIVKDIVIQGFRILCFTFYKNIFPLDFDISIINHTVGYYTKW